MGRLHFWLAGLACLWAAGLRAEERLGYRPALSLGPVERCASAARLGERVWLGCQAGLLLAGPGPARLLRPCGLERPGASEVVALGLEERWAAAATPCGLFWLTAEGGVLLEPLAEAPGALTPDGQGGIWVLAGASLLRCAPGRGCLDSLERGALEELELEGARLLGLRSGVGLVLGERLLRPGPPPREEASPWPGALPAVGPGGELVWLDPEGRRLLAADAGPGFGRAPGLEAGRRIQARGLPGLLWLTDGRSFAALAADGWTGGALPPGLGEPVPVGGALEAGLPWLLLGGWLHRPAPAGAPPRSWCPPGPAVVPARVLAADAPRAGPVAWLPKVTLQLSGHSCAREGDRSDGVERVLRARDLGGGLSLAWPLPQRARDDLDLGRAVLERAWREEWAERLARVEELSAARARLCQAGRTPGAREELEILDHMLVFLGREGRVP
jgi:hypothetical protein